MKLKFQYFIIGMSAVLLVVFASFVSSAHAIAAGNLSACQQAKAPGICRGRILRYAFDPASGNCVSFYYTGCASTENNFLTYEECRRDCMQKLRY